MTLTIHLHLPLPDLTALWPLLRTVVAGVGLAVLAFQIWTENKQ